jgi:hypothetical protein
MVWSPDRILAVVGIILAVVLFLLALGVTLAMEAKHNSSQANAILLG